jgi:hypothetical protein
VFRNFSNERLEFIKQSEPARKVKFMKASHIPLLCVAARKHKRSGLQTRKLLAHINCK